MRDDSRLRYDFYYSVLVIFIVRIKVHKVALNWIRLAFNSFVVVVCMDMPTQSPR